MSICDVKDCGSEFNVWSVSNDNKSPPFYKDFSVCNKHLNLDPSLQKIHQALVLGRFFFDSSDSVSYDGWSVERLVTTWKKEVNPNWKCDVCKKTKKIWFACSSKTKYFCDDHFNRRKYSRDPLIRAWNNDEGISTAESTWLTVDANEAPLKKSKTSILKNV